MKTSFSMYVRLDAKAALGLAMMMGETDGHGSYTTHWSPQGYFILDDEIKLEEVAKAFWQRLIGSGDNMTTIHAVKKSKDGEKEIAVCGERKYYVHQGSKEEISGAAAMTRWAANAGANVGKANLIETQAKVVSQYEALGEDAFIQDFLGCLRGEPSALNTKVIKGVLQSAGAEPVVKIGAEDNPRISGGSVLGYVKDSAYSIHPITFLLAMESLPLFAFRVTQKTDTNGEATPAGVERLLEVEGARSSYFVTASTGFSPSDSDPSLEFGSVFIFPLWMAPQTWSTIQDELHQDVYYIADKDRSSLLHTLEALKRSAVFDVYSLFFLTKADSANNLTYHLCVRFPHGEDELSYMDPSETGGSIIRITGHGSLDSYLSSDWACTWSKRAKEVRGIYGGYRYAQNEEKEQLYERLLTNLACRDDGSVEFAVAMNIRLLRVGEGRETEAFTDTLNYGEDVIAAALVSDSPLFPKLNNTGIKALQHDLALVSIDKVRNFHTILWIFPDAVLRAYLDQAEPPLWDRKPVFNGKEISLRGLPLLHGWGS